MKLFRGAPFPGTFGDHEPGRWTVVVGKWLGGGWVSEVGWSLTGLVWVLEFWRGRW